MEDMVEEVQEQFTIDSPEKAEWALAMIRESDERLARMESIYKSEVVRLDEQLEKARRRYHYETDNLRIMLEDFFETVPHEKTKTQEKFSLLSGALVRKKGRIEFKRDDQRLVAWLKDNGKADLVKVTESPAWADLKKTVAVVDGSVIDTETGAVIDGVVAEQKPDTFDIAFA